MKYTAAVCAVGVALALHQPAPSGSQTAQAVIQSPAITQRNAAEDTLLLRLRAFLLAARVPVGIEMRPFGADSRVSGPLPPRVLRQPAVNVDNRPTTQTGRPVLESFVLANPGYELIADRPVMAIRPVGALTDSKDWLNSVVSAYDVHDATVVEALTQLLRLFDPAYDSSRIRGTVDVTPRRFSVSLSRVTVRDVLDAIVLAHGDAIWMVSFSGASPSYDNSRIEFATAQNRTHVTAFPGPPPPDSPARTPGLMQVIPLPVTLRTLQSAITSSARQVGATAGFELGPECRSNEAPGDQLVLDLTGLDLVEVARLVVSHCAGYEQRMVNGMLNIGPIGSFERSPLLNLRVRVFSVARMPFRETLLAARQAFDPNAAPGNTPAYMPLPTFERATPERVAEITRDMVKPVDLKLTRPTLRDVLNALVTAHGAACWVVDQAPTGVPRLTFSSYVGWQVSAAFTQVRR